MSRELAIKQSAAVEEFELIQRQAQLFVASNLFADTKGVAQAAVKILAGRELGLGPFEAMRDVNIIQGKTTLAAAQVSARIKKSGIYDFEIVEFTDKKTVLRFTKNGKALKPDVSFDMDDAKRLGLAGKDNYVKQARTMLFWRAVTMGARMHCPEVFGGPIYTPDEISAGAIVKATALPEPEEVLAVSEAPDISEVQNQLETLRREEELKKAKEETERRLAEQLSEANEEAHI
jgi:hypothetical protein